MINRGISLATLSLLAVLISAARAAPINELSGVSLGAVRLLYPATALRGIPATFTNNTDRRWLLQSWMRMLDPVTGGPADTYAPFIAIPPLVKVNEGEKRVLRVLYTGHGLPADRESVFFLSVRMIPATKGPEKGTFAQLKPVMVNSIRVYYRPSGLPVIALEKAAARLTFTVNGDTLVAHNPTPYYISFAQLRVDAINVEQEKLRRLVPPLGELVFPIPANPSKAGKVTVEWRINKEDGNVTQLFKTAI